MISLNYIFKKLSLNDIELGQYFFLSGSRIQTVSIRKIFNLTFRQVNENLNNISVDKDKTKITIPRAHMGTGNLVCSYMAEELFWNMEQKPEISMLFE